MKKRFSYILAALVLLGCSSCNNLLNEQPTDAVNADEAIKSPSDAGVVINGIMRSMSGQYAYGRNFMLYGDVKGGDLTVFSQGRGLDYYYSFNHSATTNSCEQFWTYGFNCIMNANNLIANIQDRLAEGETGYNQYLGEAYALRAIMYFDLVRLYGLPYNYDSSSLGIPLILNTLEPDDYPHRNTVYEIYNQILDDLHIAEELLDKSRLNGYPGYYAAMAEEARVRLYMEDWSGALKCAKEVINCGLYRLYSNSEWVNSWKGQFGSESIFEIGIDTEADLEASSLAFYYMQYMRVANAHGYFLASDYFLNRLGEDETDVRWGVMGPDEYNSIYGIEHNGACYKYAGSVDLEGDGKETYSAVNIKVIRLSEVYLIAAEAALESGDADAAAKYLNAIRKRAPQLEKATAETIDIDMILDERSKELFGEGQRFFDMIRRNKSIEFNDDLNDIPVVQRPKIIDRTYGRIVLPIDQAEINVNPNMVQNTAYL